MKIVWNQDKYIAQAYHEMHLTIFGKNFEHHLFVLNSTQNDVRWGALVETQSIGNFKDKSYIWPAVDFTRKVEKI